MKDTQVSPDTAKRLYDAGYPKPKLPKEDYPTGLEIISAMIDRAMIEYCPPFKIVIWTGAGRHEGEVFCEVAAEAYLAWARMLPF